MLKDAIFEEISEEDYVRLAKAGYCKKDVDSIFRPKSWVSGVYTSGGLNMGNNIDNLLSEYPISDSRNKELKNGTKMYDLDFSQSDYGVSDSIQQVLNYYSEQISDPNRIYCISITEINKHDQPESGGWRWHKWGEYIGVEDPQMEYLYDEPTITKVMIFHIYELNK